MMQRAFSVQMVIPKEPKNSCVKYEQLTILGNESAHALPYIVAEKPTLNIHYPDIIDTVGKYEPMK